MHPERNTWHLKRDQYVLGIAPRRTGRPGAWHEVRVEVPGGLQVRTQDGYFEP